MNGHRKAVVLALPVVFLAGVSAPVQQQRTGGVSGYTRSMGLLATEIQNPVAGSMLWVFALPDR
jgi:hypothetical protein